MPEPGWQTWFTLLVLAASVAALIWEIAAADQVLLAALVILVAAGVVPAGEAFDGFASPPVVALAALFVVAASMRKTGALAFVYRLMMPRASRARPSMARLMLPVAALSAFVPNTPLVAVLAPLVQKWARDCGVAASKLLLPLSYAALLGGTCTLLGTSTNLVVTGLLEAYGRTQAPVVPGLGMFELALVGVPATLAGCAYMAWFGQRLLPEREDQTEISQRRFRTYQFELRVAEGSPLVDRTVEKAGLRRLRNAFLAHIVRRDDVIGPVGPTQRLEAGDVLTFIGSSDVLDELLRTQQLTRVVDPVGQEGEAKHLPLFEAVISARSNLVGLSLKQAGFRDHYQAVVLGIHRQGRRIGGPLGECALEAGDLLLLEAQPNFQALWADSGEFYLVAPLERDEQPLSRRAPAVLAVFLAMLVTVSGGWVPLHVAAVAAALLVTLAGGISAADARRSIDLSVMLVLGAAVGIGVGVEKSGLAGLVAGELVSLGAPLGLLGALAMVYLATNVLTEFLSNVVAASLVFPLGMATAAAAGVDPRGFAVVIAIAASAGFSLPMGYQTHLMVMGPGGYRVRDFAKVGLPLNVVILALTVAVVYAVWY